MKHIALDYHFVREQVTQESLRMRNISTKDQLANILTKSLTRHPFTQFWSKIDVNDDTSILRGRNKAEITINT